MRGDPAHCPGRSFAEALPKDFPEPEPWTEPTAEKKAVPAIVAAVRQMQILGFKAGFCQAGRPDM